MAGPITVRTGWASGTQAVKVELAARGERITMPSLEIYGHSCEGADPSLAETTILLGLGSPAT